jgi:hypothetical protein
VRSEQASTEECYATRDASEEVGGGRVSHEQFISIMRQIQANRGEEQVLQDLAQKYKCDLTVLRNVAAHCSVPTELQPILGSDYTRIAKWQ